MQPVKVLFPYVGDSVGGSHVSSLILARALPTARYSPVVAVHQDGPLTAYLESLGISPVPAPRVSYAAGGGIVTRNLRRGIAAQTLGRFLAAHGIGLVHTQDMRMHMTWGSAAQRAGAAHVWHQRTPMRAAKHARAAVQAEALLAVSEYCAASLPPAIRAVAQVVYNPFIFSAVPDRSAARARVRAWLGLPPGARCVAYVANFAHRKRPQHFVALAADLAAQGMDDLHFLMLGEARAPEEGNVRAAIAAAGLEGRCHVLGPRHPIEPWLAGSDLLVAPAIEEAFGRTLVEAQMQGTPVLASDAGGHREIVRHGATGVLVHPDDTSQFAREAQSLLTDRSRAERLADAARHDVETRFCVERHLEAVLTVYDRLTVRS
jgi:glycosyltransferase involved in cell wall biosynthesis